MKTTKIFCDVCGKETTDMVVGGCKRVYINISMDGIGSNPYKGDIEIDCDVCAECRNSMATELSNKIDAIRDKK